jgi:hypothetical protein
MVVPFPFVPSSFPLSNNLLYPDFRIHTLPHARPHALHLHPIIIASISHPLPEDVSALLVLVLVDFFLSSFILRVRIPSPRLVCLVYVLLQGPLCMLVSRLVILMFVLLLTHAAARIRITVV